MNRAARLFQRAVAKLFSRGRDRQRASTLHVESLEAREVPTVSGLVFRDYNQNGVRDTLEPGVGGIQVRAFNAAGAVVETVTTSSTPATLGQYTLTTNLAAIRLEFGPLPAFLRFGRVEGTSGPAVRFLDASANPTNVNLGVNNPADYAEEDPSLVISQFVYEEQQGGANATQAVINAFDYDAFGILTLNPLATADQVGTIYGVVQQRQSDSVYATSFMRRHAGFGPSAGAVDPNTNRRPTTTGAIYRIDRANNNDVTLLLDLNAIPTGILPTGSTQANFNTGADPHPSATEAEGGDWFHDVSTANPNGSVDLVGKISLGDLKISDDGRTLYTINLNSRELIEVPINQDGTLDPTRRLRRTPVPLINPTGSRIPAANFNSEDVRPFAIAVRDGVVYVGSTYTAQRSQRTIDLRAWVYAFDPATGQFRGFDQSTNSFTATLQPVIQVDLTYPRGYVDSGSDPVATNDDAPGLWRPWQTNYGIQPAPNLDTDFPTNPQPWLTGIAFDNGAMILGLRDRYGDQSGYQAGRLPIPADPADDQPVSGIAGGDILRAAPSGPGWVLENNAASGGVTTAGANNSQGPGNGEFYFEENFRADPSQPENHQETAMGALVQVPGRRNVVSTSMDPISIFSAGVSYMNNGDGTSPQAQRGQVYESQDINTFGKANGLGGLALLTTAAPIQIGDRIFNDANGNNIQDPGETGIGGVEVELFQDNTPIGAPVTTDSNGNYSFDNIAPNTAYEIRVDLSQTALNGRSLVTANQGANDEIDSDATTVNGNAVIAFTSGNVGENNHSLDIGFGGQVQGGNLTLGDRVFNDTNNNGIFDGTDTNLQGVTVELLNAAGTVVLNTTTTNATGNYTFANLAAGQYRVRLAASNFTGTGVLVGFTSSTGTNGSATGTFEPAANPNTVTVEDNDNGTISGILGSGGFIVTDAFTLSANKLNVDFGVFQAFSIGNQVFNDVDNSGQFNAGDNNIANVAVRLLASNGTTQVATTTTDSNGLYLFSFLLPGDYIVEVAASNFNTGGPLANFRSSTGGTGTPFEPAPNPNTNETDGADKGTENGTLGSGGTIRSGLLTLGPTANEPTGENPNNDPSTADNRSNLTLDFGVYQPNAAGVLSLGNTVWNDLNNNGLQDSGEAGIRDVAVELLDSAGTTVLNTANTDVNGQYTFTGLAAGDYRVRIAASNFNTGGALAGFTSSTGTNGSATGTYEPAPDPNNNVNGDDNGSISGTLGSGGFIVSGPVTLANGTEPVNDGDNSNNTNLSVDFGVFRKFSVGNVVFNDVDNSGRFNTGDTNVANVAVRLLAGNGTTQIATGTTDTNGQYLFSFLTAGSYIVELAASNFNTGGPLAGLRSSTGGTGSPFEPAPNPNTNRIDGEDKGTTNGTLGAGGTIRTAAFNLGPNATEPTAENPNNDPNTPDNQSNLTVDFGVTAAAAPTGQASIAGRVFLDYNNNGTFNGPDIALNGVTLTLSGGTLTAPIPVQTDAQGNFSFSNLPAGTYTITQTQPTTPPNRDGRQVAGTAGGRVTTANVISNIVLGANTQATGYLFTETPLVSTGGKVFEDLNGNSQFDTGEPGIPGVTITLTGNSLVDGTITPRTATTNATGDYVFDNLTPGIYNIEETQPVNFIDGDSQNGTPPAASKTSNRFTGINLSNSASPSTGFNFGEVRGASIAGVVYRDLNNDGTQDTGETGISGVTIRLTGTNDQGQAINLTRVTDSNGAYTFGALRPGTYRLAETQPTNYRDGLETAGTSGGVTTTNDVISNIVLASGATATGYNFGERPTQDLAITQRLSSSRLRPGQTVTITYQVTNRGTADSTGVESQINLGGLTFVSASSNDFDPDTNTWDIGDLDVGASQTMTITARVPARGRFNPSSAVSATGEEITLANNNAANALTADTGVSKRSFLSSSFNFFRR